MPVRPKVLRIDAGARRFESRPGRQGSALSAANESRVPLRQGYAFSKYEFKYLIIRRNNVLRCLGRPALRAAPMDGIIQTPLRIAAT
jgi:hypothetical protein